MAAELCAIDALDPEPARENRGWDARLALVFRRAGERTVVASRSHSGPLTIQRPFYPGDGACHVYVLHPPGGLAGGDQLTIDAVAGSGAAVLATTPAATKFYRSLGAWSRQTQTIRVAAGASFEWLPLDTILFGGCRAAIATRVSLARNARFAAWEMTALGRPCSGDTWQTGVLDQRTEISIDGVPRLIERIRLEAGHAILARRWGLAGHTVLGTLYARPALADVLDLVRARLALRPALHAGATRLDDLLVVRALAHEAEPLRDAFEDLWGALRPAVVGLPASAPRIWRT